MTNNAPTLQVAVADHSAVVKVTGRANFAISVTFKRLVTELRHRGFCSFVLDLTECVTMDSTFLGVMAGTALRLTEVRPDSTQNGSPDSVPLRLLNPNQRVADLLDNLGISDLFRTEFCQATAEGTSYEMPKQEITPSRREVSVTCLEAHQLLMDLNPANVHKFKDVAQFLAEDISKLNAEAAKAQHEHLPGSDQALKPK